MRKVSYPLGDLEPPEDWPAGGVNAIAADFFAWKFLALEDRGS